MMLPLLSSSEGDDADESVTEAALDTLAHPEISLNVVIDDQTRSKEEDRCPPSHSSADRDATLSAG